MSSETFGDNYYLWKQLFSVGEFGSRTKEENGYFEAELKRAEVGATSACEMSVIELGFGRGTFLGFCVDRGWPALGIEANPILVNEGIEAGFRCVLGRNFASCLSASADLIVAFDVLEHIPAPEVIPLMQDVARVLKNDGTFVARFPNGDSPLGLPYQNGDITHISALGRGAIRQIGHSADLDVVYCGSQSSLFGGAPLIAKIHTLVRWPFVKALNFFINLVFFPGDRYDFLSPNLVVVMKKR